MYQISSFRQHIAGDSYALVPRMYEHKPVSSLYFHDQAVLGCPQSGSIADQLAGIADNTPSSLTVSVYFVPFGDCNAMKLPIPPTSSV